MKKLLSVALLVGGVAHAQMPMPMSMPMKHPMSHETMNPKTAGRSVAQPQAAVSGAFVAAQPPTAKDTAAFFVLKNTGEKTLVLTGGSSPSAQSAMLMDFVKLGNGQMSMKMLGRLVLAPGQSLTLSPGGKHLMLTGLKGPLKVGEGLPIKLNFADGSVLNFTAPVQKF